MSKSVRVGVGVILKRGDTILLGKRAIDKLEEGLEPQENNIRETWALPGGKLELGETLEECAIRETLEETGIKIKNTHFVSITDPTKNTNYYLIIAFLSEDLDGEAVDMEPKKMKDWEWFKLDELPSPLFYASAQTLKKYKQSIHY